MISAVNDFLSLKNYVNVPVFRIRIRIHIRMFLGLPDQRYGSEDPDPHPDLYQNVTNYLRYKDTKLNIVFDSLLMFNRVYRLVVQSVMLVFSTQLSELLPL
jgi:hypothetical protein